MQCQGLIFFPSLFTKGSSIICSKHSFCGNTSCLSESLSVTGTLQNKSKGYLVLVYFGKAANSIKSPQHWYAHLMMPTRVFPGRNITACSLAEVQQLGTYSLHVIYIHLHRYLCISWCKGDRFTLHKPKSLLLETQVTVCREEHIVAECGNQPRGAQSNWIQTMKVCVK